MTFLKRVSAGAIAVFVVFFLIFFSWLAVAAPPAPDVVGSPAIAADAFTVTPVPVPPPAPLRLAAPESAGTNWEPVADQIVSAVALGIVAWLVRLLSPAILRVGDWLGQRAAAEELIKDDKMNALSKALSIQALDFALGRLGYTREDLRDVRIRNAALSMAADFAHDQWPEIWKWVDKDKNGQIDWFESHNATQLPPVDHTLSKPSQAPAPATDPVAAAA